LGLTDTALKVLRDKIFRYLFCFTTFQCFVA